MQNCNNDNRNSSYDNNGYNYANHKENSENFFPIVTVPVFINKHILLSLPTIIYPPLPYIDLHMEQLKEVNSCSLGIVYDTGT